MRAMLALCTLICKCRPGFQKRSSWNKNKYANLEKTMYFEENHTNTSGCGFGCGSAVPQGSVLGAGAAAGAVLKKY